MCVTWCASTSHAVEKTRKCSWSSLRVLVAVSSSSLLARCLDCCSLLDGHQRWFTHRCHGPVSQFSLTTFPTHSTSCSSVRQVSHSVMMQTPFFTCIGILLPSVHGGWTGCPLKVLVYRCHSTRSFSVIHSMVLFPSCAACSPLASALLLTFALDDTAQLSREHSTLLLSRLLPRFVGCLHTVCVPCALTLEMRRAQSSPCSPRNCQLLTCQPRNAHFSIVTTSSMSCAPFYNSWTHHDVRHEIFNLDNG